MVINPRDCILFRSEPPNVVQRTIWPCYLHSPRPAVVPRQQTRAPRAHNQIMAPKRDLPSASAGKSEAEGLGPLSAMREALIMAAAIFLLAMITAAVLVHFIVPSQERRALPWTVDERAAAFAVCTQARMFTSEDEQKRRSAAKLLTLDAARQIGANIAKLPELSWKAG